MVKLRLTHWLEQIWYGSRPVERTLLLPLSSLFCAVSRRRRKKQCAQQQTFAAPVIIVGNIAVGGTGKTPLTIHLAQLLEEHGYHPGIVSRGYGAQLDYAMVRPVTYATKPGDVGDEALMMSTRTALPVVVGIERSQAVDYLLENYPVNIVLSDDGLQHYKMARDLEIVVIDGQRRCGNGYCLPAGPLREKPQRLQECDFVVANGEAQPGEYAMTIAGHWLTSLVNRKIFRPLTELQGAQVHVVTAIGNPQRFLDALHKAGIVCMVHLYPDHYLFQGQELRFDDQLPVLMTEKDAVKCQQFTEELLANCWYLPVYAQLDKTFEAAFIERVKELTANG